MTYIAEVDDPAPTDSQSAPERQIWRDVGTPCLTAEADPWEKATNRSGSCPTFGEEPVCRGRRNPTFGRRCRSPQDSGALKGEIEDDR